MKTLATIRFPSSQRVGERLEQRPQKERVIVIRDSDSEMEDHFIFRGVSAMLVTSLDACPADAVSAYDQLVEVTGSEWAEEIKKRMKQSRQITHYRLYLDDGPCYDFLAESYEYSKK
jgi:hypothetical protein